MKRIAQIEKSFARDDLPRFGSGDTVRVHVKIKEGEKERIQVFQGTVIGRRGSGTGETVTVRKISSGIGVERVFPICSPNIAKIEKLRSGKVRRAKLYYLRELTGKSARIKERITDHDKEEKLKAKGESKAEEAPAPEPEPEVAAEAAAEATEAEPKAEAAEEATPEASEEEKKDE